MGSQVSIGIGEQSQVGEARRAASKIAAAAGFDEQARGDVAIVASELATNLSRYAQQGRLFVQALPLVDGRCVELVSIDAGPGMADVHRCLQDGYSTGGTAGNGLGAVRRLSTVFDVYSSPAGTVVLSRICRPSAGAAPRRAVYDWAALSMPAPHEERCGDTWRVAERDADFAVTVVDGLGHGPLAAEAADRAGEVFEAQSFLGPAAMIERLHPALTGSRGAAVALAQITGRRTMRYASVGNIFGSLVGELRGRGLASQNGTVGVQMRKVQELEYEWPGDDPLIMHSDGLTNRWSFDRYPGLRARHPAVVAGVLWRDCTRGRDDATIVVVRNAKGGADV